MKYETFREKIINLPVISGNYLKLVANNDQSFKNQLSRWEKNGKLISLRKDLYILNENDRKINPSRSFISSELYKPSYVSMEYALEHYGLIPERVSDITCITSKKTKNFENIFGKFIYQHVKTDCFTGFIQAKDEAGLIYNIALPEKAFLDFLYLNLSRFNKKYKEVIFESYRFQNLDSLNKEKLFLYANLYKTNKLMDILKEVFND